MIGLPDAAVLTWASALPSTVSTTVVNKSTSISLVLPKFSLSALTCHKATLAVSEAVALEVYLA